MATNIPVRDLTETVAEAPTRTPVPPVPVGKVQTGKSVKTPTGKGIPQTPTAQTAGGDAKKTPNTGTGTNAETANGKVEGEAGGSLYGSLKETGSQAWDAITNPLSAAYGKAQELTGHKTQDYKNFMGDSRPALEDEIKHGLSALYSKSLAEGKGKSFSPSAYSRDEILKAGKGIKDEDLAKYMNAEGFQDLISGVEEAKAIELAKEKAKESMEGRKQTWDGALATTYRVLSDRPKETPKMAPAFAGSVKADLAGLQGVLNSRGNAFGAQPLKMTA